MRRMIVSKQQNEQVPEVSIVVDPPVQAPAATVVKGINFGGIKNAKADSGRKVYPVMPDPDGMASQIAAIVIELHAQVERFELAKAQLGQLARPFYFRHSHGKIDVPSSVQVNSPKGDVLVQFKNQYKAATDPARLRELLGPEMEAEYFKQRFMIKIDGDKIPAASAQTLINELQCLFDKHGALDALSASDSLAPLPTWHSHRHMKLAPELNEQIDDVCGIVKVVRPSADKKPARLDPTKA